MGPEGEGDFAVCDLDVWVVVLFLRKLRDGIHEYHRFGKIFELEGAGDFLFVFVEDGPGGGLGDEGLDFFGSEEGDVAFAGEAVFF